MSQMSGIPWTSGQWFVFFPPFFREMRISNICLHSVGFFFFFRSGSCSGLLVELVPFFQVSSRTFSSRVFNALSLCLLKREKNSGAWAAALSPFVTDGKKEETVRMRCLCR